MKKTLSLLLAFILAFSLCACSEVPDVLVPVKDIITENIPLPSEDFEFPDINISDLPLELPEGEEWTDVTIPPELEDFFNDAMGWTDDVFSNNVSPDSIPEFSGAAYCTVNNNMPFFTEEEKTTEPFEIYSDWDSLGRCGTAYANLCIEIMPTEDREDISSVYPSGWKLNGKSNNHEYSTSLVEGGRIYNRCHLIGFQLAGENANELNLVTGTRYMNVTGMLPFENMIDDYIEETNNHVLYRVTPVYEGTELVCRGVLMEAWSVEDNGDGICFNVYCYNVQPGIEIDYATGENWLSGESNSHEATESQYNGASEEMTYIINTNSQKFHLEGCTGAASMSEKNREEWTTNRETLIDSGYSPCGICNP